MNSRVMRTAGWLAVAGLLSAALIGPSAVFATDLHGPHQGTSWDAEGFACPEDSYVPPAGEVMWHFVLTKPDETAGHIAATFKDAGTYTVADYASGGDNGALHWYVFTGYDTLLDAKTTDVDGGNLVLSHICPGETTTTTTTSTETTDTTSTETTDTTSTETTDTTSTETTDTTSTETTDTTSTETTDTTSTETTDTTSTETTDTTSTETTDTTSTETTDTTSTETTSTGTGTGSVEGATGTPDTTPPATDTVVTRRLEPCGWHLPAAAGRHGRPSGGGPPADAEFCPPALAAQRPGAPRRRITRANRPGRAVAPRPVRCLWWFGEDRRSRVVRRQAA